MALTTTEFNSDLILLTTFIIDFSHAIELVNKLAHSVNWAADKDDWTALRQVSNPGGISSSSSLLLSWQLLEWLSPGRVI